TPDGAEPVGRGRRRFVPGDGIARTLRERVMSLADRWQAELAALREQGRHRTLSRPAGIDFSSNDYLGYSKCAWGISRESRSGTASRLLRGHHSIWDEVESCLADWHGANAALMMTSGYTANEGLLSTIIA